MENQQNIMPCDLEAERSIIGAMIIDERAVDDAAEIVEPVDFYSTKYQEIYKAILQVIDEKKPVDYITLEDQLKSNNMYEIIGGIDELISISEAVGSAVNVKYYSEIVKSKAIIRNLMRVSQDVIDMSIANNSVGEVLELVTLTYPDGTSKSVRTETTKIWLKSKKCWSQLLQRLAK